MQRPVAQLKLVQSMLKIFVPPRANSVFGESELHTQHMWSVWRCWPKSAEVVCEVRRLRSQNSMGAWRATCGARLPFYFVCYASFGGMAVATPLITTSPCWLVHTVSSLTIFFSGNSSRTVQVAVTVSPI